MINLFQPTTGNEELQALSHTLDTHWLGKGAQVQAFEAAWAKHVGAEPANMVSTNSCTSALFEAVRLARLGKGDEVIIPTIHFVGAAQAVLAVGAKPVFCDVDKWTLNATYETIKAKLTKKTKAVIMNHYGGVLAQIIDKGDLKGLIWIDDLANAPVADFPSLSSDYACWSFDAMKILTTGDGGMLYCDSQIDAAEARMSFCLGVNSESGVSSKADSRWWEFFVPIPGRGRHLMNDMQAAMGLEQLKKLDGFVARRKEIVKLYEARFAKSKSAIDMDAFGEEPPYYFYWLFTPQRDALAVYLREHGIYTSFRYWPLHLAYNTNDHLPNAEWVSRNCLNLPLHNSLTDSEVETICDTIEAFYVPHH